MKTTRIDCRMKNGGWIGRVLLTLLTIHCSLFTSVAQDTKSQFNPVEHAVISQTIAPDARSAGMGDVGAATDPDVNSQYWNLAKYPFCISRAGIALNYTPWLRQLVSDIDLAYVAGYYRIGDYAAVSGSLRYFSLGEVMTSMDENAMTVKPYEMSLDVGASLMLSEKFSLAHWVLDCAGSIATCVSTIPRMPLLPQHLLLTSAVITTTISIWDSANVS